MGHETMTDKRLAGRRILVVEDEMLIVIEIEDILAALGCVVVGPTGRLNEALYMADNSEIDAAILDITIRGDKVFPVAEKLIERGVPFIFASGYADWALPPSMQDHPRLTKPFLARELEDHLLQICSDGGE